MNIDPFLGSVILITAFLSPLTTSIVRIFGFEHLESISLFEYVARIVPMLLPALRQGFGLFLGIPLFFIGLDKLNRDCCFSCIDTYVIYMSYSLSAWAQQWLWFQIVFTSVDADPSNVLGQVLLMDLILLEIYILIRVIGSSLSVSMLLLGPLAALCQDLGSRRVRGKSLIVSSSLVAIVLILYAPGLDKAYRRIDYGFLGNRVSFDRWSHLHIVAAVQVFGIFLLICSRLRFPNTILSALGLLAFLIILNGNVAAAWLLIPFVTTRAVSSSFFI